jgi:hypothetical protein
MLLLNQYIQSVSYAELFELSISNRLNAGMFYRIVDFSTRHNIPNSTDFHQEEVEVLIVRAATDSKLHTVAISEQFPTDIIHYTINNLVSGSDKGVIFYRKDTVSKNEAYEDIRGVLYRRWDNGSGNFVELTNNGNGYIDQYMFGGRASFTSQNNSVGDNNNILSNNVFGTGCNENKLSEHCTGNTFLEQSNQNTFGFNSSNNVFYQAVNNQAASYFSGNVLLSNGVSYSNTGCVNNTFGHNFQNNVLSANCSNNYFGDNCRNNVIGMGCTNNYFSNEFSFNAMGELCTDNFFGTGCSNNTIPTLFSLNRFRLIQDVLFQNGFSNNTCDFPIISKTITNAQNNVTVFGIRRDTNELFYQDYVQNPLPPGNTILSSSPIKYE